MSTFTIDTPRIGELFNREPKRFVEDENIDSRNRLIEPNKNGGSTNGYSIQLPDDKQRQVRGVELFSFRLPSTQDNIRTNQTIGISEFYDISPGLDTVCVGVGSFVRMPHCLVSYKSCLPLFPPYPKQLDNRLLTSGQQLFLLETAEPGYYFTGQHLILQPNSAIFCILQALDLTHYIISFTQGPPNGGGPANSGTIFMYPPKTPFQLCELANKSIEREEDGNKMVRGSLPRVFFDASSMLYYYSNNCMFPKTYLIHENEIQQVVLPSQNVGPKQAQEMLDQLFNCFEIVQDTWLAFSLLSQSASPVIKVPLLMGEYSAQGLAEMTTEQLKIHLPCVVVCYIQETGRFQFKSNSVPFDILWTESSCPKLLPLLYGFIACTNLYNDTCFTSFCCVVRAHLLCNYSSSYSTCSSGSGGGVTEGGAEWVIQQSSPRFAFVEKILYKPGIVLCKTISSHCFQSGDLVQVSGGGPLPAGIYRVGKVLSYNVLTLDCFSTGIGISSSSWTDCSSFKIEGFCTHSFQLGFSTSQNGDIAQILGFPVPFICFGSSLYKSRFLPWFHGTTYVLVQIKPIPGTLLHQFQRNTSPDSFFVRLELERGCHYFDPLLLPPRLREDLFIGDTLNLSILTVCIFNPDGTLYDTKGVNHSFVLRLYIEK